MINLRSFADELEKIATSRWKAAIRAGEIGAGEVKRLRKADLLNYSREISGLNVGTKNIAKKLGIEVKDLSKMPKPRKRVSSKEFQNVLSGEAETVSPAMASQLAQGGGGYAAYPQGRVAVVGGPGSERFLQGTKGDVRSGLDALARRHEIDELRSAIKRGVDRPVSEIEGRPMFQVSASIKPTAAQKKKIESAAKKAESRGRTDVAEEMRKTITEGVPYSQLGSHISPDVILRESYNVATLPPGVRSGISKNRMGESMALRPHGLTYGTAISPQARRRILKSFERGELSANVQLNKSQLAALDKRLRGG